MQCKIFSVPVGSEQALDRERKLNDFLGTTDVKRIFASLANQPEGPIWSVLFFYEGDEQVKSIVALKKWRADQAEQENVPLYMVAQNKWLEDIVRMPVRTLDDLGKVRGLGEWRVQKYGAKIVEVLNAATAAKRTWPSSSYSAGRA